ncbi:MAG TPA: 4Fe-4S dicluster domain-containing protein [Clostridia bacterium]|nr:4Fe-4S dicluster domain-containing protein [Clostridia bacterium]
MNKTLKKIIVTALLTAPFAFGSYFVTGLFSWRSDGLLQPISVLAVWLFINTMLFITLFTGKTDKVRAILFITMAIAFPIGFILQLFELRGHFMTAVMSDVISGNVPFCHIVIPQTIIPAVFTKQIVFPGTMDLGFQHSASFMIIFWLGVSLFIGKGWCSWTCFYGGWEDGCSRLSRKARIKLNPKLVWGAVAVLLLVILTTIETASPTYCLWLCPFKACSEFFEVASPLLAVQTVIFIVLFIGLVIILPFLSKKRVQCMVLCPFGAFQSAVDKINPFDIRIDKTKCLKCKKCIKECPVMAISEASLEKGKMGFSCMKCGKCVDICPGKAAHFHIKGTPVGGAFARVARTIFLYLAFTIFAGIGAGIISSALYRILLLITTGSMLTQ